MKTNIAVRRAPVFTHEGAKAQHINPEQQLRRSVMACLLWEDGFYESGQEISSRIAELVPQVKPQKVAQMAIEAREKMKLRHVPLFLVREMARHKEHKALVSDTLSKVIQRADELSEFVSIYWKDKKQPLSKQVKLGLAKAFGKFDEYALAKYNRDGAIKLRDVLFLCHAKPEGEKQADLWKRLIDGKLQTPDTWEVELSASKDKKASWTRLLDENKLGALALLRNLRNMREAGVDQNLVNIKLDHMKTDRVLPFRFIAAARTNPTLEPGLENAMFRSLAGYPKLSGHTVLLVDVSGSMNEALSSKSDLKRCDAACGLAMLLREICEQVTIYSFSMKLCTIPSRRGFALRDAIDSSQEHSGTPLGTAVECIYADRSVNHSKMSVMTWGGMPTVLPSDYRGQGLRPDRLIVITDEQSANRVPDPIGKGYIINVASNKNGVGYGPWTHVDGFSESIVSYIQESEQANLRVE